MAGGDLSKTQYEKLRDDRVQENKRKLAELGVLEAAGDLNRSRPVVFTPAKKTPIRRHSLPSEFLEKRKSARVMNKPAPVYAEVDENWDERREAKIRRTSTGGCSGSRGFSSFCKRGILCGDSDDAKASPGSHPSFVRSVKPSHVSSCFWLGLPAEFCIAQMPETIELFLLTVEGERRVWESKYLPHKCGLSGGWRGFAIDMKLEAGDCLVFELISERRFRVHIFRHKIHGGVVKAEDAAYTKLEEIANAPDDDMMAPEKEGNGAVVGASAVKEEGEAEAMVAGKGVKVEGEDKKKIMRLDDVMKVTKAKPAGAKQKK